jgi:hypothetical protein
LPHTASRPKTQTSRGVPLRVAVEGISDIKDT